MDSLLEIKKLSFDIGDKKILDNLIFNIERGSFCSIIGPNGSGKTTLLKHILNILKPEKNTVFIEEKEIEGYSIRERAKKIAWVPQDMGVDYDYSVEDIVLMGRTPYLSKFQEESIEDMSIIEKAMKATNTLHLRNKNIRYLSGGERQRVIIARALAQEGQILLMDEPTSHLDIQHQIEIMDTVKKQNSDRNLTVVAVLHDLNIAASYSDYLILLHNGRILAEGSPEEVLTVANVKSAYNISCSIVKNPINHRPYIIPAMGFPKMKSDKLAL